MVSRYTTYIHTYFICHKLSIVEYKYYVDSNGRLPEKLVLIVLAPIITFIISIVTQTHTHTLTHNKRMKPRKKKEKTDGDITFKYAKDCLHIHNHV